MPPIATMENESLLGGGGSGGGGAAAMNRASPRGTSGDGGGGSSSGGGVGGALTPYEVVQLQAEVQQLRGALEKQQVEAQEWKGVQEEMRAVLDESGVTMPDQLRQAINQIKQREKHGESTLQVGSSSSSSA